MALDEYLYGKIANYFKKRNKTSSEIIERSIKLEDIKSRLTIFARAITGKPIEIYPAEREGGYKNNNFFLPASYSQFPTMEMNLSFYLFRILYLSVQKNLNFNWIALQEKTQEQSQQKLLKHRAKF